MKYNVTIKQIEIYHIDNVEAGSEDAAMDKAEELMESKEKDNYHHDSDREITAYEN